MFRTLIYPSSGACDYSVELPHWSYCSWFDVCWSFGVVGVASYPCWRLKPATRIPLQPNHTSFSLLHGYHTNPTTPASACYTDTTPTQPHQLQPATWIPLQPNHTSWSLLHGYHYNPTTPAAACYTDTTPTQTHRLQPAIRIALQTNHTS